MCNEPFTFTNNSHPPADKCVLKVISDHTKNSNIYLNLASCSSSNHCFECKLAVEVFSFDSCLGNTSNIKLGQHFQNFIFLNRQHIFANSSVSY